MQAEEGMCVHKSVMRKPQNLGIFGGFFRKKREHDDVPDLPECKGKEDCDAKLQEHYTSLDTVPHAYAHARTYAHCTGIALAHPQTHMHAHSKTHTILVCTHSKNDTMPAACTVSTHTCSLHVCIFAYACKFIYLVFTLPLYFSLNLPPNPVPHPLSSLVVSTHTLPCLSRHASYPLRLLSLARSLSLCTPVRSLSSSLLLSLALIFRAPSSSSPLSLPLSFPILPPPLTPRLVFLCRSLFSLSLILSLFPSVFPHLPPFSHTTPRPVRARLSLRKLKGVQNKKLP